jgi:hypothetical protein
MEAPAPVVEREKAVTPKKRLSGTRAVAAPKAFNEALGGALAKLGGADGEEEEKEKERLEYAPTDENPAVGATVAVRQPVQVHEAIAAAKAGPSTDMTDLIRRTRSRVPVVVAVVVVVMAGVGAGVAWWVTREEAPKAVVLAPPPTVPTVVAAPAVEVARASPTTTTMTTTPTTTTTPTSTSTFTSTSGSKHHGKKAQITIKTDVAADAFVDGRFVHGTPVVDYEVAPGRHIVRVESAAAGLRLIPREQVVELQPGEHKELPMNLK